MIQQMKKVIWKFKDQTKVIPVVEFVGLKSKIYSFWKDGSFNDRKVKGINKSITKKIKHEEYEDLWFREQCVRHEMKRIQSKDHKLGTYKINFDDWRYILDDGIKKLLYDHKDIYMLNEGKIDSFFCWIEAIAFNFCINQKSFSWFFFQIETIHFNFGVNKTTFFVKSRNRDNLFWFSV